MRGIPQAVKPGNGNIPAHRKPMLMGRVERPVRRLIVDAKQRVRRSGAREQCAHSLIGAGARHVRSDQIPRLQLQFFQRALEPLQAIDLVDQVCGAADKSET